MTITIQENGTIELVARSMWREKLFLVLALFVLIVLGGIVFVQSLNSSQSFYEILVSELNLKTLLVLSAVPITILGAGFLLFFHKPPSIIIDQSGISVMPKDNSPVKFYYWSDVKTVKYILGSIQVLCKQGNVTFTTSSYFEGSDYKKEGELKEEILLTVNNFLANSD